MESQPQHPEFRNIPEIFHPCKLVPALSAGTDNVAKAC